MAKVVFEAMAKAGEYQSNGETKTRWQRVGTVFEGEKGLSMKIDCIPVGQDWNGWVSFFTPKPKEGQQQAPRKSASFDDMSDDVPWK